MPLMARSSSAPLCKLEDVFNFYPRVGGAPCSNRQEIVFNRPHIPMDIQH